MQYEVEYLLLLMYCHKDRRLVKLEEELWRRQQSYDPGNFEVTISNFKPSLE